MKNYRVSRISLSIACLILLALALAIAGCSSDKNALSSNDNLRFSGFQSSTSSSDVELSGIVESIDAGTRILMLVGASTIITVAEDAEIERAGSDSNVSLEFSDITIGDSVEVRGELQGEDSLLANRVRVFQEEDDEDDDDDRLTGVVESIDVDARIIKLEGDSTVIVVDSGAKIERHGSGSNIELELSDVVIGDSVEVRGLFQDDGSLLANEVRVFRDEEDDDVDDDDRIEGTVESVDVTAGTITLVGNPVTIRVDKLAEIEIQGEQDIELADIEPGDFIVASGDFQENGAVFFTDEISVFKPESVLN